MTDDDEDYLWLAMEGKKLAVQCEMREVVLIAAAVICLDRINDRLCEIAIELESLNAELEKRAGERDD